MLPQNFLQKTQNVEKSMNDMLYYVCVWSLNSEGFLFWSCSNCDSKSLISCTSNPVPTASIWVHQFLCKLPQFLSKKPLFLCNNFCTNHINFYVNSLESVQQFLYKLPWFLSKFSLIYVHKIMFFTLFQACLACLWMCTRLMHLSHCILGLFYSI